MKRLTLGLAAAALLAGPAMAYESPQEVSDAFVAAVADEDADALAALYAEGAESYGPDGMSVQGRTDIKASWQAFFDAYDDLELVVERRGAIIKDDFAAMWGHWTLSATPVGGKPEVTKGRYTDVMARKEGGWVYVIDHASIAAAEDASE